MKTRLAVAAVLPLAIACGGGQSTEQTFRDAAPSASLLAMDIDAGAVPGTATTAAPVALPFPGDLCHPHLFVRTEALVARLNRHVLKALSRVERVMQRHPLSQVGDSMVWVEDRRDEDVQFTIARTGDTTFTWELDVRPDGTTDWTKVFWGTIDRAGATGPHQGSGDMTLDLTALHDVEPTEPAMGKITAAFDLGALARKLVVDASGVAWDRAGDLVVDLPPIAPKNARYVYLREPGKGGSLKIADEMVFYCPANPQLLPADVDLVSAWFRAADGSIHGRSDAKATGGQIASGDTWVGLTCHGRPAAGEVAEGYWLMKLEQGASVLQGHSAGDPTACDPAFGPVPAVDSTANDLDFSKVDFTTSDPYPFPGMM
jgi:hypothetical protein